MLYILQFIVLLVWFIYIVKKNKYSIHGIINAYFFFLMLIDVCEGIFTYFFDFYEFTPHLLADPIKDNELGLIFCDGYLLPLTGIILCHYAITMKSLWKLSFIFAALNGILECIYLWLGYLKYNHWSVFISIAIYFFSTRIFTSFAPRLLLYKPPMPHYFRIAVAAYSLTIYIGAYISGALINLYQWRPFIINDPGGDDRFTGLIISVTIAAFLGFIIPKSSSKIWPVEFYTTAVLVIAFSYFSYSQGWLIYHKWNHIFTALYWIISFSALALYNYWDDKFTKSFFHPRI